MPAYDYFCPNCENEKEIWHGMFDEPETLCEKCGEKMKKAYTAISFSLKGQGWVSKGSGTANKPKHFKEIGIGVPEVMSDVVSEEVKRNSVGIRKG